MSHSASLDTLTNLVIDDPEDSVEPGEESLGIWGAADTGDVDRVQRLLDSGVDVNTRNCLGCVPLMYAAGSGHSEVVSLLLSQPGVCVNIRNNDRLTCFMLAMQVGRDASGWTGSGQKQLRRMMDMPALSEVDWTRNDRWTVLMEAASFGQSQVVSSLLTLPDLELDAVNIRGQTAAEVALNRSHPDIAAMINTAVQVREKPEEVQQIQRLEAEVEQLKVNTRRRLIEDIDDKNSQLESTKTRHEHEMEPLTREIDKLQQTLDDAIKKRLKMITKQVNEVKSLENEIQIARKQLDTFDRLYGLGGPASPGVGGHSHNIFEKDFECPVCYEIMCPPSRIFQCNNGHLICEVCKGHTEIRTCPTCRVPLGPTSLMRNIPMEKLAKTYFDRCSASGHSRPGSRVSVSRVSRAADTDHVSSGQSSRRSSISRRTGSLGTPSWPMDDFNSSILDW